MQVIDELLLIADWLNYYIIYFTQAKLNYINCVLELSAVSLKKAY